MAHTYPKTYIQCEVRFPEMVGYSGHFPKWGFGAPVLARVYLQNDHTVHCVGPTLGRRYRATPADYWGVPHLTVDARPARQYVDGDSEWLILSGEYGDHERRAALREADYDRLLVKGGVNMSTEDAGALWRRFGDSYQRLSLPAMRALWRIDDSAEGQLRHKIKHDALMHAERERRQIVKEGDILAVLVARDVIRRTIERCGEEETHTLCALANVPPMYLDEHMMDLGIRPRVDVTQRYANGHYVTYWRAA